MGRHTGKSTCLTNQERKTRQNVNISSQSAASTSDQLFASRPLHEVLQQLKASTKVLRRIAKGARMLAATSWTARIEDVAEKKSESS
ncbi:hypothetical protein RvY_02810 [Ramazzottius varieornatus]|uniref:Uncharacterized protein n=1 Tax=Ramazzottius varieornatus TaxID=947166 RepID=A0A1D1UPE7_RAMVA|nr:hypothetical protein RvY_02810 [Ramazzottius varieornatus]